MAHTRTLEAKLLGAARRQPVVTLTGPRQSGKTTLARKAFPQKPYVSLEDPDQRSFALEDPRGFLAQFPQGAVLDEIQRTPELFSYLQTDVDAHQRPGRWVLTGSQNLALVERVGQSLAGRTALLTLLPLAHDETRRFGRESPTTLAAALLKGGYPALYQRRLAPRDWLPDYVSTYVERDVRQLLNVMDLPRFQSFLKLCAGRTGQLLNLSALGADAGISQPTAQRWVSALEASYLVARLRPWHQNITSRLVKTPKLHFLDSGLVCSLLGIHTPGQLLSHPLRGAIFESWVVSEALKWRLHRGLSGDLFFFRDRKGVEVDVLFELESDLCGVEVKSAQTWAPDFAAALDKAQTQLGRKLRRRVVLGADTGFRRADTEVLAWHELAAHPWA
jgi:uncharacterized protein